MQADLAQGAVENIASSLHVVQRFLDEARAGARPLGGMYIGWDDLLAMLPPLDECHQIFHCFFTEVRAPAVSSLPVVHTLEPLSDPYLAAILGRDVCPPSAV